MRNGIARIALAITVVCMMASSAAVPAFADAPSLTVSADTAAAGNTDVGTNPDTDPDPDAAQTPSIAYRVCLQDSGWQDKQADYAIAGDTAQGQRITALRVALPEGVEGGVKYSVRRASGIWTSWRKNGKPTGTYDTIEAIRIKLTGAIAADYDVVYCVNLEGVGWQKRVRNGAAAGTRGAGIAIRAIKVALVKKSARSGWVGSKTTWRYYKNGVPIANQWFSTAESPIDLLTGSDAGKKRYWIDADGLLAIDRLIDPATERDAGAGKAAYASAWGYPVAGKYSTDAGFVFAKKSGRLYDTSRWLTEKTAEGKTYRYRLKKTGTYAVARTGMFKIGGKKYYAWPDTGRIMRSKSWWLEGSWYTADKNGVLTKSNNKKKQHIERYVKWALKIARNDAHGYSQVNRWGPDYDCSSLVVSALRNAGFPTGAAIYTGNMREELESWGFRWYTDLSKLRRGDILLVHHTWGDWNQHTEIFIGDWRLVGASSSENGGIDGETGDQTGWEIRTCWYYDMPWDGFLRYVGMKK